MCRLEQFFANHVYVFDTIEHQSPFEECLQEEAIHFAWIFNHTSKQLCGTLSLHQSKHDHHEMAAPSSIQRGTTCCSYSRPWALLYWKEIQ